MQQVPVRVLPGQLPVQQQEQQPVPVQQQEQQPVQQQELLVPEHWQVPLVGLRYHRLPER